MPWQDALNFLLKLSQKTFNRGAGDDRARSLKRAAVQEAEAAKPENNTQPRKSAFRSSVSLQNAISLQELALQNLSHYTPHDLKTIQDSETDDTSQTESAQDPLIGEVINGLYRIDKLIAQGGMGQIFLARHLGREAMPVSLKLLIRETDTKSVEYERFVQEMLISGRLRHPNLVKVLDYGILLDGLKPYMVMEYIDGQPLRQIIRTRKTLPLPEIAQIIIQACDGLHEVHENGVVHRDLKPENLMIKGNPAAEDNVKILDFGIAQLQYQNKFDEEGLAVGSLGYMSPEQICAQAIDQRTDIYSLGLIFYEALTGSPPFSGANKAELLARHVREQHQPPSTLVELEEADKVDKIVARALAKHPDNRYQNVRELQNELQELLTH